MANLLAGIPWWLSAALLLAGMVMLVHANRHNSGKLRSIGLVVTSLAVLMGVLPFLIDTDAEKAERRTRQLVDSADKKDWTRMQSLLDADTHISLGNKWPDAKGSKEIAQAASAISDKVGLEQVFIVSLKTTQTPDQIAVTFSAASKQEASQDRYYPSGWEFDFRPTGNAWDLREIRMLSLGDQSTQ
jgi:hypothetical protein